MIGGIEIAVGKAIAEPRDRVRVRAAEEECGASVE